MLGRHEFCESEVDEDVFAALRQWRSQTARDQKVPAFVIFTDATLMAIAEAMPADDSELLSVSGVGPQKLERYGAELLEVIRSLRG